MDLRDMRVVLAFSGRCRCCSFLLTTGDYAEVVEMLCRSGANPYEVMMIVSEIDR